MIVNMDMKALQAMRALYDPKLAEALEKAEQTKLCGSRESDIEPAFVSEKAGQTMASANDPPSMSAFTSRLLMPVSDEQGAFDPSIARHAVIKPGTVVVKHDAVVAKHDAVVAKHDATIETKIDSGAVTKAGTKAGNKAGAKARTKAATKAGTKAARKQAATGKADDHNNHVSVIDFAYVDTKKQKKQEEEKEANKSCAIDNTEDDWVDEEEAAELNRAAYVKEIIRHREIEMEAQYKRYMLGEKKRAAATADPQIYDANGFLILDCRPVKHARNPDGTLVSELSLQLRRESAEIFAASEALGMDIADDALGIDHGDRDPPPVPYNTPTSPAVYIRVGNPPSPPISNAPDSPPQTPTTFPRGAGPAGPSGTTASVQPPPVPNPAPVSTQAVSTQALEYIPRRGNYQIMTPPLSLPVVAPSLVSAVATIVSQTSTTRSANAASASQDDSFDTSPSTLAEDAPLLTTSDGTRLIRTPRVHDPNTMYGSSAMDQLVLATGISRAERLSDFDQRRSSKPKRLPSSYLLGKELTSSLHEQILNENNTIFRANYYGPERNKADKKTGSSSKKITRESSRAYATLETVKFFAKLDEVLKPAGPLRRNRDGFYTPTEPCTGFGNQDPPGSPEIDLMAELAKGECYDYLDSPNTRGW